MGKYSDELKKRSKAIDEKLATGRFKGAGEPNLAQGDMPVKKTLAEAIDPKTLPLRYVVFKHVGNDKKVVAFLRNDKEADDFIAAMKEKIVVDELGEMIRIAYSKLPERQWRTAQR